MVAIRISKHSEKNNVIYYEVSNLDDEAIKCYMGIDKDLRILLYYFTEQFDTPFKIIDLEKLDEPIDSLSKISRRLFLISASQGIKALQANSFPDDMSYFSCA